ncbi:MAG: sugar transferase [Aeromicrobium sp.]|nr:sugar transferase [Aeromicrobium sp.]
MSIFTSETSQRVLRVPSQRGVRRRHGVTLPQQPASRFLRYLPLVTLAVDLLAIFAAEMFTLLGPSLLPSLTANPLDYVPRLVMGGPVVAAGWIGVIALRGGYDKSVFGAGMEEFRRVLNASFVTAAVIGVGCYLAQFDLSRSFFFAIVGGSVFVLMGRLALRLGVFHARRHGRLQQRVLVVGTSTHVDDVVSVLTREKRLGYDVVGAAVPGLDAGRHTAGGTPVLGSPASVVKLVEESRSDVVFLAGGSVSSAAEMRLTAAELKSSGVGVILAPSITDVSRERIKVRPVGGLPLIHVGKPRSAAALARAKRSFDLVGSGLLILALSPILAFASYKVWRNDRGPILFRQERIGVGGTPFACLKFRTMVVDAEARLFEVLQEEGTEAGLFAKIKDDPRITKAGKWMRRCSIDELPQLFNVFKGDMSLIGPRPQVAHEVAQYDDAMARRLRVRPGMTGLWQVSGRSDLSVAEAIRLDLYYVDNWSMLQDLSILARTFGAVVGSDGAY